MEPLTASLLGLSFILAMLCVTLEWKRSIAKYGTEIAEAKWRMAKEDANELRDKLAQARQLRFAAESKLQKIQDALEDES